MKYLVGWMRDLMHAGRRPVASVYQATPILDVIVADAFGRDLRQPEIRKVF